MFQIFGFANEQWRMAPGVNRFSEFIKTFSELWEPPSVSFTPSFQEPWEVPDSPTFNLSFAETWET